jgi:transposase
MKINKTTIPRALVRSGWYREVRVKSREAMLERSLLGARTQLLNMVTDLSNQILMKTVPKGAGTVFECAGCSRMRQPWRPSCCHCWTPGAPCGRVPPTSIGNS